jgi:hypothetical protein
MRTVEFIDRVYRGVPGWLVVNYETAEGAFVGKGGLCRTHDKAVERIERLDAAGARGVYLRTTTVDRELGPGKRGSAMDAHFMPGLWGDLDFGTIGHAHDPERHGGLTLPPDEDAAMAVLKVSGLPSPSLLVHSGGGLYPWWLLEDAAEVTDDSRAQLEALSAGWQKVIGATAARLGYHYGTGVGDLARVLRVPGTTNRKEGRERPCRVVEDAGTVYTLGELLDALRAAQPRQEADLAGLQDSPGPGPFTSLWEGIATDSPLDRFAASTSWAALLARYGFTRCTARHGPNIAECFTRPGEPSSTCSAHTLTANPHALVVHSENAGLPTGGGQKLTKARVVAHMEHGGDLAALRAVLLDQERGIPVGANRHQPGGTTATLGADLPEALEAANGSSSESDDQAEAALDYAAHLALEVEREAYRLRVRDAAREKVNREKAGAVVLPALVRLSDFLAVPDAEVTHRIAGLWPSGGRVVFAAPHKSGKTTNVGNVLRCLVDGTPFLDRFAVTPARRVLLLDNELDENMLRRWLRDQGIRNVDAVELVPMRGRLSTFNILDPAIRSRWAENLGPGDVLVFDCLRPALDALGLSEDKDAGRFLEALDELTTEAGIAETLVVHHMGHQGERSRGDSRILDWPDALWKLVKDAEDDAAEARRVYFTAYGRDVDQPEVLLTYDAATRRLSVGGGSRKETRSAPVVAAVVELLEDAEEPLSGRQMEEALTAGGHGRDQVRSAVKRLRQDGRVRVEDGPRRAKLHTLTAAPEPPVRGSARPVRGALGR